MKKDLSKSTTKDDETKKKQPSKVMKRAGKALEIIRREADQIATETITANALPDWAQLDQQREAEEKK